MTLVTDTPNNVQVRLDEVPTMQYSNLQMEWAWSICNKYGLWETQKLGDLMNDEHGRLYTPPMDVM